MSSKSYLQTETHKKYSGTEALVATEKNLLRGNTDIVSKLSAAFGPEDDILEFGAGIGALAVLWAIKTGKKPDCLEIDEAQVEVLQKRGLVTYSSLNMLPKKYDGIYTSNVLEHIEDDCQALKQLHLALKDGGTLAIFVPAFQCLFSEMDRAVGHYRRYSKKDLLHKLAEANYAVVKVSYVDSLGFFVSLILKLFNLFSSESATSPTSLKIYDSCIYPVSKFLDKLGLKFLLGKNLLVIARKAV